MISPSRTAVAVTLVRVLGVGAQTLVFAVLANKLPVGDVGLFAGIYVFWTLVRMLGPVGFDQLAMREIAASRVRDTSHEAQALCNFSLACVAGLNVALSIAVIGVLLLLKANGHYNLPLAGIAAAALGAPAYSIGGLMAGQLRGFERNLASQSIESVGIHLPFLVCVGVLGLAGKLSLGSALIAQACVAWLVAFTYLAVRIRCGVDLGARLPRSKRTELFKHATQIWQALAVTGLASRAPVYISLATLGPAATGVLDIAIRFGSLPTIVISGVATTFSPIYAARHASGDNAGLEEALSFSSWLGFLPAAGMFLVMLVGGPWLLSHFFPPAYQHAYLPALLMCAACTVNAGFGTAGNAYLMSGRQRLVRLFSSLYLVTVIGFGFGLAPLLGVVGIGLAVILGSLVRDLGLSLKLGRELNVRPGLLNVEPIHAQLKTLFFRAEQPG